MTIFSYPVLDAAKMAAHAYKPSAAPEVGSLIVDTLDKDDVQAFMLSNGFLLIPGSNSLGDYLSFNFRVFRIGASKFAFDESEAAKGASGTMWHQGFLAHAKVIFDWVGHRRPKVIIGHSLGAAATQILSKSWGVTGIGFAAPRTRKSHGAVVKDGHSLSICRKDDIVTSVPGTFGHLGAAKFVNPRIATLGLNHAMRHYIDVIGDNAGPDQIPRKWPQ